MKALAKLTVLVLLFSLGFSVNTRANGDDRLNLPGDNLNLYAVMDLFQESETLEAFERSLNAEDSKINNLDLNGNNLIDYIKVIDYVDGDAHTIVLQVAINERENQDVAVFTVYKDRKGQIQIQLVGDEYLYGKDYIIEPYYAATETPNPGYTGNTRVVTRTTYIEVQSWPVVRYIYMPTYSIWRSPWYWGYYPAYWNPWRPYYYDYYYGFHSHRHNHYYGHYRHCNYYSYPRYADYYYHNHRSHSLIVRSYRDNGRYKDTYSRPDLREEGSRDYQRHYANSDRSSNRQETNLQGRTKQDVKQGAANRSEKPVVNNRVSKSSERSSTTRTDTKRDNATPAVNNRSSKSTERSANDKSVSKPASRPDSKSQSAKPAETRTSSKPSARQSSDQGVKRQVSKSDNKSQPARSSESGTSAKPSARQSSDQGMNRQVSKSDNKSQSARSSESRTSAKPSARQSSDQGMNRQISKSDNKSQSARSSESRASAKPSARQSSDRSVSQQANRQSNSGSSVKASQGSSSKSSGRSSAQTQKSGSGVKSNKSSR